MIYNQILLEKQRLEEELKSIQKKLSELPEGKLICARNGPHIKWYQNDGNRYTYIPKGNRRLAEQLAARRFLSLQAEYLLHERKAIDCYLRHHTAGRNRAELLLTDTFGYSELLTPFFSPPSRELLDWMNSPYLHNEKNPEQLIHGTISGNVVRSKSEAIIAMLLHMNQIPFRYECALTLGEITIFPDFTIRHPESGQFFYWEHFGMMDNPTYCKNTASKLQLYAAHGIIPTVNLITTYETKDHPLSSAFAKNMVKYYFLEG